MIAPLDSRWAHHRAEFGTVGTMTSYNRLGNSGLTVSTVGLGCNNLGRSGTRTEDQAGTDAVVSAAIDAGITLFDVADTYGAVPGLSEERLGKALGARRGDVVLATKFGMDMKGANGRILTPGVPGGTSCGPPRPRCAGWAPTG